MLKSWGFIHEYEFICNLILLRVGVFFCSLGENKDLFLHYFPLFCGVVNSIKIVMVIVTVWVWSMGLYSIPMVKLPFSVLNRKSFDQLYRHRFPFILCLVLSVQQGPVNIQIWISYQYSNFAFGKANSEIALFQSEVDDSIREVSLLYCNKNGHHCLKL